MAKIRHETGHFQHINAARNAGIHYHLTLTLTRVSTLKIFASFYERKICKAIDTMNLMLWWTVLNWVSRYLQETEK